MNIKFKRLPNGKGLPLPSYATPGAAGIDLCAAESGVVRGDSTITKVPTGFSIEIPHGFVGLVRSRSGLAFKNNVVAFHGTIDSDFRGELMVGLTGAFRTFERGERIAQIVVVPVLRATIEEVTELSNTARGDGGFGSTGA